MRKALTLTLSMLVVSLLVSATPRAHAAENPMVWVYDEAGNTREVFTVGEKVRIKAYSSSGYEVKVLAPSDDQRKLWTGLTGWFDSGLLSDITDELGWWEVKAGSTTTRYASAQYNVIPEVGTLMAMVASFGALAGLETKRLRLKR